jgi:hypothetical protein
MKITQHFDETGMKGILLWVAGPFAAGGLASLAGLPMMMIGREFRQETPR